MGHVERHKVGNYLGNIASKRGTLRELCVSAREVSVGENLEEEIIGFLREIDVLVDDLRSVMERDDLDLREGKRNAAAIRDGRWSLGTEEIRGPLIPFLRGKLEPIRRVVVAPDLPKNVIALFLIAPNET